MKSHRWSKDSVLFIGLVAATMLVASTPLSRAADEKLPAGAKLASLEAHPAKIALNTPYAYSQILITGRLENGESIDVTCMAKIEAPAALVSLSPTGQVRPAADGSGKIKLSFAGQHAEIPVTVRGQKDPYEVSFVRDVMPVLSKIGCNAGTCHGAQSGKNGFKLSLRGYDPLFDHRALTDDLAGRRFNRAAPDQSLMLLKPSGGVPHVGGVVIHPGEPWYELLRAWIADGVKLDLASPRVSSIDIFPKGPVVPLPGMKQQMSVIATYADGSSRDVTAEAFVESSNTEVASVTKQCLVTALRRGEAAMLARYEGTYTATTLVVMGDRSRYVWKDVPEYNLIDTLVDEKLRQVKVQAGELCTEAEFFRRVHLDLTGLPPQPDKVRAFLADSRPSRLKREEIVDRLIGSPDFIEHWTNKWADLLQVNRKFLGVEGALELRKWIEKAIATDMPYDKFVETILTASGSTRANPPASYYQVLREPGAAVENTTQLFLAVRFNCNKCHDHPFERWTQDQYYQLAAYFAQVGRTEDPKYKGQKVGGTDVEVARPAVELISDLKSGEVKHERTGAVTAPAFPFRHRDLLPATAPRRQQLAHWVASKDNPYFAKSYVNRIWAYLLGTGIIEPIDDIRAGNPPSNPKLLDRLTAEFIESGFDTRHIFRLICKSRVYQQSVATNRWNQDDDLNYSHAIARRLPAEVLYDAIERATGAVSHLPGLPPGSRAVQLLDSSEEVPSGFMALFGKPPRESACECERSGGMMLGPVLNLVNGPIIGDALNDPSNRLYSLTDTQKDDTRVIEDLFLGVLCRMPTPAELETGKKAIHAGEAEHTRFAAELARLEAAVKDREKQLPKLQAQWEKTLPHEPVWTLLEPASAQSAGGATLTRLADGSLLAGGRNPRTDVYTITGNTPLTKIAGIRLDVLPDPSLPAQGPGRSGNGNFVLTQLRLRASPLGDPATSKRVILEKGIADIAQAGFPPTSAIDGKGKTGWAILPAVGREHVAVFEAKEPVTFAEGMTLTFTLDQRYSGRDHNIGRLRLSVTDAPPPLNLNTVPPDLARILSVPKSKRTADQKSAVARYFRDHDTKLTELKQAVADYPKLGDHRLPGLQDLAWALLNSPEFLFNH